MLLLINAFMLVFMLLLINAFKLLQSKKGDYIHRHFSKYT